MNAKIITILTIIIISTPFLSIASEGGKVVSDCWNKTESHVDAVDCAHKVLEERKKQLEQVYSEVLKKGKTLDEEMKAMGSALSNIEKPTTQSQKDFEQYMESECERQVSLVMGGTAGADIAISCRINLMNERLNYLNPRYLNSLSKGKLEKVFNDKYLPLNFPLNTKLDDDLYLIAYSHPSHLASGLYVVNESDNTKEIISRHDSISRRSSSLFPFKYYVVSSGGCKKGRCSSTSSIIAVNNYTIYEKTLSPDNVFDGESGGCGREYLELKHSIEKVSYEYNRVSEQQDEVVYKQVKTDCKTKEKEDLEQKILIDRKSILDWKVIYEW